MVHLWANIIRYDAPGKKGKVQFVEVELIIIKGLTVAKIGCFSDADCGKTAKTLCEYRE